MKAFLYQKCAVALLMLVAALIPSRSRAATAPVVTVLTPAVTQNVSSPLAIALDPKGYYYVADLRIGGITKFTLSGQPVQVFKVKVPARGVAVDSKGNLLVSQEDAVAVLNSAGAQQSLLGSGRGQFVEAAGIAVDARGYIFVVDSGADKVKVFTAAGQYVQDIGGKGSGNGQFSFPTGIAYEKAADQIVVADTRNSRLQFFSATGSYSFVKTLGSYGTDPLQFKTPVGVAFQYTSRGVLQRMYVADLYQNRIQVIDPLGSGTFLSYIAKSGLVNGLLMVPMDLALDAANKRLIVVNGNGHLNLFGIDGGINPPASQPLTIDPLSSTVSTSSVTMTGGVAASSTVKVVLNSDVVFPVSYTSSTTWKATISSLVPGTNVLTVSALDNSGVTTTQSVGILYTP